MKYTPEVQLKMISRLLWKDRLPDGQIKPKVQQLGLRLFKYFKEVDATVFKETFSSSAAQRIVELLGTYYGEYTDLPSKEVYRQIKKDSNPFQKWLKLSSSEDKQDLRNFERALFKPPEDEDYTIAQLIGFIVHCFLSKLIRDEAEKLRLDDVDPIEVIKWSYRERKLFIDKLNSDILNEESEGVYIFDKVHSLEELEQLEGLKTCYESIVLYFRGITIVIAGPKSFKSGLSQNVAVDLVKQGADVLFADLENGKLKMERRFYQSLLQAPKEWFYSGVWVDTSHIIKSVKQYEEDRIYLQGEKVYRIRSYKDGKKEVVIEGKKKQVNNWKTVVRIYEAIKKNPQGYDDWRELSNKGDKYFDPDKVYVSLLDKLNDTLEKIKAESGGDIRLEYIKSCTPGKLDKLIVQLKEDPTNFFSDDSRPKVVIIDWGQHLKSDNRDLNYWQAIRENYADLKELRDRHNIYMLMIEAPKDYEKLTDEKFRLRNLKIAGTGNIGYDVECAVVSLATEEEKEKGYRRLVLWMDRDRDGGDHVVEYLHIDYDIMTASPIDRQIHMDNCPEFWEEQSSGENTPTGKKKKGSLGYQFSEEQLEDA